MKFCVELQGIPCSESAETSVFNVKDYGVTGDGTTDDTVALQTLIDNMQDPALFGLSGGVLFFPLGDYLISDTIKLNRHSLILQGSGIGDTQQYAKTGKGTTIVWNGANDRPMFHIENCAWTDFRDMRIEGKNSSPPTAAFEYNSNAANHGIGNNSRNSLTNILIGRYPWAYHGTNEGSVQIGVLVGGENVNNDQFKMNNVKIEGIGTDLTYGMKFEETQSVWNLLQDIQIVNAQVGIYTAANQEFNNLTFTSCGICLQQASSSWVVVNAFNSELCGQLVDWVDFGSKTTWIKGGYSHLNTIVDWIVHCDLQLDGISGAVVFEHHKFIQNLQDPPPKFFIRGRGIGSIDNSMVFRLLDCHTSNTAGVLSPATFDVSPAYAGAFHVIEVRSGQYSLYEQLEFGDTSRLESPGWTALDYNFAEGKRLTFTDATRPAASTVDVGGQIFNIDDGFPNWSDGTNWVDATGAIT